MAGPRRPQRRTADVARGLGADVADGCARLRGAAIDQYSTGARLFETGATNRALPIEQWTQRAVRTNDRVYVFLSWGGYEVRDSAYVPIDENVDAQAIASGFEELSRFTRK